MKKACFVLLLICSLFSVSAMAFDRNIREQSESFDSIPMLEKYYDERRFASDYFDDITVSIITASKDDPIYSWFGHAAILVESASGPSYMYDYGRFSFGPDFYANFAMGRLWYKCCKVFAFSQLNDMKLSRRTITKTVLNLTNEQKEAVIDFLDINASSAHDTYLYHHYRDNCSTRLRDIVNKITDGDFEQWAKSQKGLTYRQSTSRILHNNLLWQWLLDFLQSGNIDGENTRWEDMFLPSELSEALAEYNNTIVGEQSLLADFSGIDTRPVDFEEPQSYIGFTLIIGIAIALIALILKRDFPKAYGVFCFILVFVLGLLGSLLFFMGFFTSHDVTWNNWNLLFINPLLLIISFFQIKSQKHSKLIKIFYRIILVLMIVNIVGKYVLPALFIQANLPQILTVLPLYLVFAFA